MAYEIAGKLKRGEEIIRQAALDKQLETAIIRILAREGVERVEVKKISNKEFLKQTRAAAKHQEGNEVL
jgi:hypothetical protein